MKKIYISSILWLLLSKIFAQQIYPHQLGTVPLALNPAFAGTSENWQVSTLYKVQYPTANAFSSSLASFDSHLENPRNSIGVFLQRDVISVANGKSFRNLQAQLNYAYLLPVGEYWRIKMAVGVGYGSKNLNTLQLIYGDQLDENGYTGQASSEMPLLSQNIDYLDIQTGILAYNEYAWIGFSAFHLNQPTQDFLGAEYQINRRFSGHLGIKIPLNSQETYFISPLAAFYSQNNVHLLDGGIFLETEALQAGVLYRNIPIQTKGANSLNFQVGFKKDFFRFSYSYAMMLGSLNGLGGGHEIGLRFMMKTDIDESKWSFRKISLF
ncbi:MAG: PorP/SprF family type IX secretion system membrane protein [Thermonemataceae bacterium]|nr:PorP/SprF family type IX secretion system membrane protein [Thermonemataceae bacterium]